LLESGSSKQATTLIKCKP